MDELRECPFCDGDRVDYDSMLFTKKGLVIYAKCPDCGTSFRVLEHIYNTRPSDSRQAREIAELRDKCLSQSAEIERLRWALAEYANRDNWTGFIDGPDCLWIPDEDGYTRAEEAMKGDNQ